VPVGRYDPWVVLVQAMGLMYWRLEVEREGYIFFVLEFWFKTLASELGQILLTFDEA
jgi:hypothetical protein